MSRLLGSGACPPAALGGPSAAMPGPRRQRPRLTSDQKRALYSAMDVGVSFVEAVTYARSRGCTEDAARRKLERRRHRQFVEDWNATHPVGTQVLYQRIRGGEEFATTTRSPAFVASDRTAVIFLTGAAGFWALDFVRAAEVADGETDR